MVIVVITIVPFQQYDNCDAIRGIRMYTDCIWPQWQTKNGVLHPVTFYVIFHMRM